MSAFPNTRDAIGDSWNSTSRRARRISRHSREAAQDIGSELRTLISEIEETLSQGTSADVAVLRAQLSKSVDSARARLNDTHDAVRARANTALADADTYIHDKPWQAIALVGGLAAGAGLAIAAIITQGTGKPCKTGNNKPDQAGNVPGGNSQCDTTLPDGTMP